MRNRPCRIMNAGIVKKITGKCRTAEKQNDGNDGSGCEAEDRYMRKRDCGMDDWLNGRIDEDLIAMAEEREKLLMESEELRRIDIPAEKLEEIRRRAEKKDRGIRRIRIRRKLAVVLAAVLALCAGMGLVGTGSKLYRPEIIQRGQEDEPNIKINNTEAVPSEFDDEEVCREIQEKLGVLPVRFGYQPKEMCLKQYQIKEDKNNVLLCYETDQNILHIYINKDYSNASINNQSDSKIVDTLFIESCDLEVEVLEYQENLSETYYVASFEYLNTYYFISGMMEEEEFIKILENIWIKNV